MFFTHAKVTLAIPIFRLLAKLNFLTFLPKNSWLYRFLFIQTLPDVKHESIHPIATLAPWRMDKEFSKTMAIVEKQTLVDVYRCFDLWSLVEESAKVYGGDILEVGVWRGGSGALMAKKAKMLGLNLKVYLADTFEGVVKAGAKDTNYKGGEFANTSMDYVNRLGKKLDLDNLSIHKGIFPDQFTEPEEGIRLRLCHIDVDTYDSAKDVLEWAWPRLNVGGFVVFDDYGFYNCTGVTRLVDEYRSREDLRFVYNINGHAIFTKMK